MIDILIYICAFLSVLSFMMFAMIGMFLVFKVIFLPKSRPVDESNRIAHLRLVWFAITRPEIFVDQFWWLSKDEYDNFNDR